MKYNIRSWYITFLQTRVGRNAAPPAGITGRSAEGRSERHPTGRNGPGWPLRLPRIEAQYRTFFLPAHIGCAAARITLFQSSTSDGCHAQPVVISFVRRVVDRFLPRVVGAKATGTDFPVMKLMQIL